MDIQNTDTPDRTNEVDETTFSCTCEITYETDGDRESFSLVLEPMDD